MKRLFLLATFFIYLMNTAYPSNPVAKPDFAFPKTVATQATADLKKANKQKDAHGVLNALIRLCVADALIDPESIGESLKTIQDYTDQYAQTPLGGVFYTLQAKLYFQVYQCDRWKYDRRQLPLSPLPADINEWSGEQFKEKIAELLTLSYSNPTALNQLAIADYKDIVEANNLTRTYYPTMLDFVCQQAASLLEQINKDSNAPIKCALGFSPTNSAPSIIWHYNLCRISPDPSKELLQAFKTYKNCEYSAPLLIEYCNSVSINSSYPSYYFPNYMIVDEEEDEDNPDDETDPMIKNKEAVSLIDSFMQRFPNNPMADNLTNIRSRFLQPIVSVSLPTLCAEDSPLKVSIDNTNAQVYELLVYKIPQKAATNNRAQLNLDRYTPLQTLSLSTNNTLPFREICDTTIQLPSSGYYAIVPRIKGQTAEKSYPSVVRCIPIFPFTVNGCESSYAVVANSATGLPVAGALVTFNQNNSKTVKVGSTTDKGMLDVTKALRTNLKSINVNYHGAVYEFDGINPWMADKFEEKDEITAQVLTDRAIYHFGDKIQALAILTNTVTKPDGQREASLATNKNIQLILLDANWQRIDTCQGTTDAFGRFACDFEVPKGGLSGRYRIQVFDMEKVRICGNGAVTVSDYKLPEFELIDLSVSRDCPVKGAVTITGKAATYAGTPVADASVDVSISEASWWRWFSPQTEIYATTIVTDATGVFKIELGDSIFASSQEKYFTAQFNCISPSGTSATASVPFSLGKPYQLSVDIANPNIDGTKLFKPAAKVYNPDGETVDIPLKYEISLQKETLAEGDFSDTGIDLSKLSPNVYTLTISPIDNSLADPVKTKITLYNTTTNIVPGSKDLFVPITSIMMPEGEKKTQIDLLYGTKGSTTAVYYTLSDLYQLRKIDVAVCDSGYHHLKMDIPADFKGGKLQLTIVKDCKSQTVDINLSRQAPGNLQIVGESFRDKLIPQSEEQWKIKILNGEGNPIKAALALDMYNHAMDALVDHSFSARFPNLISYSRLHISVLSAYTITNRFVSKYKTLKEVDLETPVFNFYGQDFLSSRLMIGGIRMMKSSRTMQSYKSEAFGECDMAVEECADLAMPMANASITQENLAENEEDNGGNPSKNERFDFRDSEVHIAIWAPMLSSDGDGNVTYDFTVPNANATWRLLATAWSEKLETGALIRELVANKPVMVMPNTPRFLRAGDRVTLTASVINNTDSTTTIHTEFELFNPVYNEVISSYGTDSEINANSSQVVSWAIQAPMDVPAIGVRVKSSNGKFADGEQVAIPILPSEAALIETYPFYLNPGEKTYQTSLPGEKNARLSLSFCENPAWTIVSALPGMRKSDINTANGAAASIFSAAIAQGILEDNPEIKQVLKHWLDNPGDSALASSLEKNEDLKQALLDCTPWVQAAQSENERMANLALIFSSKETKAAIEAAITLLSKLQCEDGGWTWGEWCTKSSYWTTLNVLAMFAELRTEGWLPKTSALSQMIDKALAYIDKEVEDTDIIYAIIRPQFDRQISLNGQKVISNTTNYVLKNWKKMANPAQKAMAAEVLWLNNYQAKAQQVMKSITEFGVWSKDQGLRFPSVNALYDYAILLEAYALIEPNSKEVDGLRQQLIVRKQGTDWGSSVVTNEVVASILKSGSKWTVPNTQVKIEVGGVSLKADSEASYAIGQFRMNLSEYKGEELKIETPGVGPAYGAVFAQFDKLSSDVKAVSCEDLSIEKQLFVQKGTEWVNPGESLEVGDRVKVLLTIHCKRNLNYVTILDNRPAAFEPVQQLPGWMYSEGIGFYRENRDSFTGLYVEYMRPGTYLLTYEMNVSLAGSFISGIATIQSQYAPEISAHSSGSLLLVK